MSPDYTPEGDEIKTSTIWLSFSEGDTAITLDFTRFNAALKKAEEATDALAFINRVEEAIARVEEERGYPFSLAERAIAVNAIRIADDYEATMRRINDLTSGEAPTE